MNAVATERFTGSSSRRLALLSTLALGAGLFLAACQSASVEQAKPAQDPPAAHPAARGAKAPNLAKSPKELALADFLKKMKMEGRPVLIEFGSVGCELSDKCLDAMIALEQSQAASGLAFLRVEGNEDAAAVKAYFQAKSPPFPVYQDSSATLAQALGATAIPTFLLVDKFGHVRYTGKYPQESIVAWAHALRDETRDPGSQAPLLGAKTVDVAKLLNRQLPDLSDAPHALKEYQDAGGLLLLFVDTSCPYSLIALKDMPMVSTALAGQKINVVVLNCDDSRPKVQKFYARNDPAAPVLYDVGPVTREQWNVQSVPIAVYVTPARKIGYQGQAIWANMGSAMEIALNLAPGTIQFTAAGTGFG